jgi:beta-N-acetylhexosaminidase
MQRQIAADAGRVLWIGFPGPEIDDETARTLAAGDCGAVILFARNVRDLDQVQELNRALHAAAPALLVAVDQEGGTVQRVRAPATEWPPMLRHDALAAYEDEQVAEAVGRALGNELAALGFDVDFAPVLDVHSNEANPVIGKRAFGRDATTVTRRALAFARGLAASGILGCGKHFPGHGDTSTDSHLELPRIEHDLARLEAVELAPFRAAATAGVPMIMTAHVVFSALDPEVPATLSRAVVQGLLRERLAYRGVIVSDDLDMKAIVDHFGIADAAVRAIDAGCDVLLACKDLDHQRTARDALIARAERDSAFRARLGEAASRVRALEGPRVRPPRSVVGAAAHRALAERLAGA